MKLESETYTANLLWYSNILFSESGASLDVYIYIYNWAVMYVYITLQVTPQVQEIYIFPAVIVESYVPTYRSAPQSPIRLRTYTYTYLRTLDIYIYIYMRCLDGAYALCINDVSVAGRISWFR